MRCLFAKSNEKCWKALLSDNVVARNFKMEEVTKLKKVITKAWHISATQQHLLFFASRQSQKKRGGGGYGTMSFHPKYALIPTSKTRQVCFLCRWRRHLMGSLHLGVVSKWPLTLKRTRSTSSAPSHKKE